MKELAVLAPPLLVAAAFLVAVGALLRHEMVTRRRTASSGDRDERQVDGKHESTDGQNDNSGAGQVGGNGREESSDANGDHPCLARLGVRQGSEGQCVVQSQVRFVTAGAHGICLGRKTSLTAERASNMVQRTVVTVVCDFPHDGDAEGKETVSFAYGGTTFEIDLCDDHAKELSDALGGYAAHARRISGGRRRRARSSLSRERSAEVRSWARERGHKVSDRGRIAQSIVEEYDATH